MRLLDLYRRQIVRLEMNQQVTKSPDVIGVVLDDDLFFCYVACATRVEGTIEEAVTSLALKAVSGMDVTNPSMTKPINKWTIAGVDHVLSLKNVSFLRGLSRPPLPSHRDLEVVGLSGIIELSEKIVVNRERQWCGWHEGKQVLECYRDEIGDRLLYSTTGKFRPLTLAYFASEYTMTEGTKE
mgnify:FL=1